MTIVLFVICGLLWIVAFGALLHYVIGRKARSGSGVCSRTQLLWQSLMHTRRQQLMAYWSLSMGVFTVFAVGLNRPDFTDSDMIAQATGGYDLYADCRVPVQYDLNNEAVRQKLSLTDLPYNTHFLQFLRHSEDEASCLNLNKVETPTVLGVDIDSMAVFGLVPEASASAGGPVVYVDSESLIWSMMMEVGDTIMYRNANGVDVPVVIAGTYPTGVFHGNAIMANDGFRRLWPDESGVEVMLVRSSDVVAAYDVLSVALSEYGLSIQTAEERMRMFFEVTDTYLLIFLTLGGLGLLLGVFSMLIIVRKNLTVQRTAIQQYEVLGFRPEVIRQMLLRENVAVPLFSVIVGAIGSVISISANIAGAGVGTLLIAAISLAALCLSVYYGIKLIVNKYVL